MEKTEHFLFLSSNDSLKTYTTNKPYDFTVSLPSRLRLEGGGWLCALIQGSFCMTTPDSSCKVIIFMCDLVQQSYIRDQFLPVLDIAHQVKKKNSKSAVRNI